MREIYLNWMISGLYRRNQIFLNRKFKAVDLPFDLGQLPAMMQIYQNPGISQERIAARAMADKGTIARAVKQLEEKGLIKRESSKVDRRLYQVYPTNQALALKESIFQLFEELHDVLYNGFSEQEIETMFYFLERMKDNIEEQILGG